MDLLEHFLLQNRAGIGQKDVTAVMERLGQDRVKRIQHVQMDSDSVAGVHVLMISALPAESFSRLGDQAGRVDVTAVQQPSVLSRKVIPDNTHESRLGEETGRISKKSGRAAQSFFHG